MQDIKITDNYGEMIKIGKEIADSKSHIYKEWGKVVIDTIRKNMPSLSDEEVEECYYRSIYDYWVYGSRIDEWFLYRFFEKTHEQKNDYVTTRRKFQYVRHLNNESDRYLLDDKYETYMLLSKYYLRDVICIKSSEDYQSFKNFVEKHPSCVVKPLDATYGQGVYKLEVSSNYEEAFDTLLSKNKTTQRDKLTGSDGLLLEELIIQDDALGALHPGSVQCLRCNTLCIEGKAQIFATSMKIGIGNQFVTSLSGGSLTVGINRETGVIETQGFSEVFGRKAMSCHPDTHIPFVGYQVPQWNEMKALAIEAAEQVPTIGYIAWDLALSKKGWCIIEGNYAGEFFGMQLPYNKGVRPRLESELKWKPEHLYWWKK